MKYLLILAALSTHANSLEKLSDSLRNNDFFYQGKYSGDNDEIFSIVSHIIERDSKIISSTSTAQKIIEKDLNELNTVPTYVESCKNHIKSNSIINQNLKSFLASNKATIKYEYEFAGKIQRDNKGSLLKRVYQCYFSITNKSQKEFTTNYFLKNRNINEQGCNKFINDLNSKTSDVLIEYNKYYSYRYDNQMSDGIWAYHCAISLSK